MGRPRKFLYIVMLFEKKSISIPMLEMSDGKMYKIYGGDWEYGITNHFYYSRDYNSLERVIGIFTDEEEARRIAHEYNELPEFNETHYASVEGVPLNQYTKCKVAMPCRVTATESLNTGIRINSNDSFPLPIPEDEFKKISKKISKKKNKDETEIIYDGYQKKKIMRTAKKEIEKIHNARKVMEELVDDC